MSTKPAFSQTWTQTSAPNAYWLSLASSADGTGLAAAGGTAGLYTSTNSGNSWVSNNLPAILNWYSIASSADGNKLVAGTYGGGIYTSTNAGMNWNSAIAFGTTRFSIASSADGSKLVAAPVGGQIYTSTDSGVTWWPASSPNTYWRSVTSSADGSKLAAAWFLNSSGGVYTSTNSGNTWTTNSLPSLDWYSIASSADGSKLVAVGGGSTTRGPIYISTNSGNSWASNNFVLGNMYWECVGMSADGKTIAAANYAGDIFISRDGGISWTYNSPSADWASVASSADGGRLAAAASGNNGIWNLAANLPPQLNPVPFNSNLMLSWLVPSTNFVLQQNPDLTTTNWTTLTNSPTLNLTNLQEQVWLSPSNNSGFFRLVAQ